MYSNSPHYQNHGDASVATPTLPRAGFFGAIVGRLTALLTRSAAERAQAYYRARRLHQERAGVDQEILRSLPIEEKLRLGMYRFMD